MPSPDSVTSQSPTDPKMLRKAVTGAAVGNAVEWFDFAVYGFLATYIAGKFFPSENETASLLSTFAVFAAAFFCALSAATSSGRWPTASGGRRCSRWSSC